MTFAWVTMCVQWATWNIGIYRTCLESISSLLLTSASPQVPVIVLLDALGYASMGSMLQKQPGVLVKQLVHQNATALIRRNWSQVQSRQSQRPTAVPREVTSLLKLQVFNLTQFSVVCWFDSDVLFLRNASVLLTTAPPFASIVLRRSEWGCKGRDYINDGVMLLRPSTAAYDTLYASFISGDFFDCGGSERMLGDQDVVRHHLFETKLLGPLHEWPICYNYRTWASQRHCVREDLFLIHVASHHRERPKKIRLVSSGRNVSVADLPRILRFSRSGPLARHAKTKTKSRVSKL
mmetsp:Transcript_17024/g.28450  ORF Transcript_17024/g.28450 Transcript_17024/m.28450 type:complete len:293 (+) Transcript_17024:133-1011(+)